MRVEALIIWNFRRRKWIFHRSAEGGARIYDLAGFIGTNLIGTSIRDDFDPDEITYQTKPDSPVRNTVSGIFSQSDFFITDGSGDDFYPDIYGSVLTKFPNPNDESGEVVSTDDTVVFDPDTGAISLTHDGEGSPYLDGTLTRKGLGILFSFPYNNFEDDASLNQALGDVDAASATIRFNIGFLEGELAKVSAARRLRNSANNFCFRQPCKARCHSIARTAR